MGVTTFMLAVGGTSLVCYVLMTRAQNRSTRWRGSGGDNSLSSGGSDSGGGSNILNWFGGDGFSSANSDASSSCGAGGDAGAGDCGGGGDGGGG